MYDRTNYYSSIRYPSLSLLLPTRYQMIKRYLKESMEDNLIIKLVKELMRHYFSEKFEEYYSTHNELLQISFLMDNRFKHFPFHTNEEKEELYNRL